MSAAWTEVDRETRDRVLSRVRQFTRESRTIPLDRHSESFSGRVGSYRFLFEGEEDLLHLIIERADGEPLELDECVPAAQFLLEGVPEAAIWMRPGKDAHHYYLGHDLLLGT